MEAGGGIKRNQGSKRRRLDERAWRELFKSFDGAGLTVEALWQREGLSRSSFNRWRSRQIAFLLGYSERSAFNQAYLRWNLAAPRRPLG